MENSQNTQIGYNFIPVPTQLFLMLDSRLKLVLISLIQVSGALANAEGWFFYSMDDLKKVTGISADKAVRACLETFYRLGILEVRAISFQNNIKNKKANYYRVNFKAFEAYNNYSVYECLNNPALQIEMLNYTSKDYKTTYTACTKSVETAKAQPKQKVQEQPRHAVAKTLEEVETASEEAPKAETSSERVKEVEMAQPQQDAIQAVEVEVEEIPQDTDNLEETPQDTNVAFERLKQSDKTMTKEDWNALEKEIEFDIWLSATTNNDVIENVVATPATSPIDTQDYLDKQTEEALDDIFGKDVADAQKEVSPSAILAAARKYKDCHELEAIFGQKHEEVETASVVVAPKDIEKRSQDVESYSECSKESEEANNHLLISEIYKLIKEFEEENITTNGDLFKAYDKLCAEAEPIIRKLPWVSQKEVSQKMVACREAKTEVLKESWGDGWKKS